MPTMTSNGATFDVRESLENTSNVYIEIIDSKGRFVGMSMTKMQWLKTLHGEVEELNRTWKTRGRLEKAVRSLNNAFYQLKREHEEREQHERDLKARYNAHSFEVNGLPFDEQMDGVKKVIVDLVKNMDKLERMEKGELPLHPRRK